VRPASCAPTMVTVSTAVANKPNNAHPDQSMSAPLVVFRARTLHALVRSFRRQLQMLRHDVRSVLGRLWFPECPRWHRDELWFTDKHAFRVIRTTMDGVATTVAELSERPSGIGFLPDGRLLVVATESRRLVRIEPNGDIVEHADLSDLARGSLNDMVVTANGVAYVGDMGFGYGIDPGDTPPPGQMLAVTPEGDTRCVADDLAMPNGTILTEDGSTLIVAESLAARLTTFDVDGDGTLVNRRRFAELHMESDPSAPGAPDGICLDREGAVWATLPLDSRAVRVREGGEVTDSIRFDDARPFACVLGGADRRTLLLCLAPDWRRDDRHAVAGSIVAVDVSVPGTGQP
jgi:sugar lactone lactonase YvrE